MLLSILFFQISQEDVIQVGLPFLLQCLDEEVLIIDHELLQLLLIKAFVLEFALVHFAHTSPMEILAGELAEVV